MGLQRSFNRREYFRAGEKPPTVLDNYNDKMPEHGFLHATKGYRLVSEKRSKAQMIVAEQKKGKFPPAIFAWQAIKRLLGTKGAV